MPRQLRNRGGMTVKTVRQKYGLGSLVKKTIRKLIPNELADIAVKAAPFVAPFNPGAAALMRGVGRFDQRGSISDALKQGAATYGFGQAARFAGGAGFQKNFLGTPGDRFTTPFGKETGLGKMFGSKKTTSGNIVDEVALSGTKPTTPVTKEGTGIIRSITDATLGKVPLIEKLPKSVLDQLVVGGITSGASALYSYFSGDFRPQEEGETMEEYLAARKASVGKQMRTFMDNYYRFDSEYSAMSDAERDAFVARYNMKKGGRVGYQTGGITMTNTLAQNRAINNARRAQNQAVLQEAKKKAFNVFMTPQGNVAKDQGIAQLARDTGKAPQIQNYAINSGTDISRLIGPGTGISEGTNYGEGQTYSNLGFAALQPATTSNQTTTPTTVSQTSTAPDLTKQSEAFGKMMEQKFEEAYGKPEDYRAEAASLNMPLSVYMDYLLTYDPKDVAYSLRKQDPYYDPQFDMPRVPEEKAELNPLRIYFNRELQRQIDAGIPESERIKFGEVIAPPTALPSSGTMPSLYESYEDALARTRADMGLASGGRVGQASGGVMGIPVRTNSEGIKELDYRKTGGFVPIGVKEKADDVPAMLSKNEFVFTADAVRGAGNGSIKKGAQRMYDTMKKLESRVG